MAVLLYLYGIVTDRATNTPGHRNNVVGGINATDKIYLR